MTNHRLGIALIVVTALWSLLPPTPALHAAPLAAQEPPAADPAVGKEADKEIKKEVRVVVTGEGEPQVFEWRTPEGAHAPVTGSQWAWVSEVGNRGYLGVQLVELTPELRTHFGAAADAGVLVGKVEPGSPAEAAGLAVGDLVTAVDGETVATAWEVQHRIRNLSEGETAALEVVRNRRPLQLTATIVEKARPTLDIRALGVPPHGGDVQVFSIDESELVQNLEDLRARFSNPAVQHRIHTLRSLESELEERIAALEKRLAELEAKLAEEE